MPWLSWGVYGTLFFLLFSQRAYLRLFLARLAEEEGEESGAVVSGPAFWLEWLESSWFLVVLVVGPLLILPFFGRGFVSMSLDLLAALELNSSYRSPLGFWVNAHFFLNPVVLGTNSFFTLYAVWGPFPREFYWKGAAGLAALGLLAVVWFQGPVWWAAFRWPRERTVALAEGTKVVVLAPPSGYVRVDHPQAFEALASRCQEYNPSATDHRPLALYVRHPRAYKKWRRSLETGQPCGLDCAPGWAVICPPRLERKIALDPHRKLSELLDRSSLPAWLADPFAEGPAFIAWGHKSEIMERVANTGYIVEGHLLLAGYQTTILSESFVWGRMSDRKRQKIQKDTERWLEALVKANPSPEVGSSPAP